MASLNQRLQYKESDRVIGLPNQPKSPSISQFSGYVTVNQEHGRALFYWFFEAQSEPSQKPLLLWLNGGPGCSSIAYGAASELDPLKVGKNGADLQFNEFAWNQEANLLFVESLVGVGFSYTNTSSDLTKLEDAFVAEDAYNFLVSWLQRYPRFKTRDFFMTGESYAGHYVPQLAELVYDRNNDTSRYPFINLKGFMVGNPLTDDNYDYTGIMDYAWSHSVIPDDLYRQTKQVCDFKASSLSTQCNDVVNRVFEKYSEIDINNIYAPKCLLNASSETSSKIENHGLKRVRIFAEGYDPCYSEYAEMYFNRPDVQQSIHANTRGGKWMKVILRKDGCLAAISERSVDFTDDNKWIEMDGNAMTNFHLALADEVLSSIEENKTAKENVAKSSSHKHGRSKSRSKKNLKCYHCGKKGHLKKDCWSLNKNSNPQGNTANTSDDGDALCCETSTTVEGRKRFTYIWLIDSGATYHMTSRREWFYHYEPVLGGSVYSCNDHALEIVGVRTIKLKMYNGTIKVVRDVRHVKGLKKYLLSYGLLDNNASKIETRKGNHEGVPWSDCGAESSDSAMLWHKKLGHMSEQGIKVLVEQKLLPGLTKVSLTLCEHCITSKQHRLKFNTSNSRGKSVLELVHSDVWQAPVTSLGGAKYFVSFIDDYSKRCWVHPIKKKSDVFSIFKNFKARVELDSGNKIKVDEQNLVRKNKSNVEGRTPRKIILGRSSQYRLLFGESSSINCNRAEDTNGDVNWKCKFLGYADGVKGYCLWDPTARKVIISRDVIFVEDKLQRKEDDDSAAKSETTQIHVEKEFEERDSSKAEPAHDEQEPEISEAPTTRQSDRVRRRPNWHSDYVIEGNIACCLLTEDDKPSTYHEAINSSNASLWMMAMQEEIEALHKNNTWDLVPLPQVRKPIGNKWVFKIKRNGDDQVERYRARLVVKGYAQKEDVKTTFLHGNLEEEIYMLQPKGFEDEKRRTWFAVEQSLYGLKQAPRCWYKRFDSFIMCLGYNRLNTDPCAYFKRPNKDHIEELKAQLARDTSSGSGDLDKSKSTTIYVFKLLVELQSALHLARNPSFHSRTSTYKFSTISFVKGGRRDSRYAKIHTKDNIADFMTKAINANKFTWCRFSCGLSETKQHDGTRWEGGWEYEGLTMVTVRGAGHLVPLNKPSEALALIHSFLSDEPLPSHR
ncbi:Serine carboxypeptidase-like 33 [Hibiscus syriacus]|uniref:Carboxypeptidase n=1 Tax=Hibiscus syriacus TaxID=106335 RepID=A0A6A3D0T8_HIBSY|nr:Serine carboxypeptidase-like 33 [Hibiscus syriacus]